MKQSKLKVALSTLLLTLGGCQTTPEQPTEMKEGLEQAISETKVLNSPKPLTQIGRAHV